MWLRLCADSETNVQNAVQFLDNLVKDIVTGNPQVGLGNTWGQVVHVGREGCWTVLASIYKAARIPNKPTPHCLQAVDSSSDEAHL